MKPMVYTKQNVLAFLEDRKFNSRRIINPQPIDSDYERYGRLRHVNHGAFLSPEQYVECHAKYQVGDECYVAEGYQIVNCYLGDTSVNGLYLADGKDFVIDLTDKEWRKWAKRVYLYKRTSGRFMYKSLARITFTITEVRVERLQDISQMEIEPLCFCL